MVARPCAETYRKEKIPKIQPLDASSCNFSLSPSAEAGTEHGIRTPKRNQQAEKRDRRAGPRGWRSSASRSSRILQRGLSALLSTLPHLPSCIHPLACDCSCCSRTHLRGTPPSMLPHHLLSSSYHPSSGSCSDCGSCASSPPCSSSVRALVPGPRGGQGSSSGRRSRTDCTPAAR